MCIIGVKGRPTYKANDFGGLGWNDIVGEE